MTRDLDLAFQRVPQEKAVADNGTVLAGENGLAADDCKKSRIGAFCSQAAGVFGNVVDHGFQLAAAEEDGVLEAGLP